jgi:hypothetical protein
MLKSRLVEFTEMVHNKPLQKRLSQAVYGRFPCFAPKSHISPQKSSNIHAIYHNAQKAGGKLGQSSNKSAPIIEN